MDWLPEKRSTCWAWFQPLQGKGQSSGPRDASAPPHSAKSHVERNKKGLWGHKAFRLAPVTYLGLVDDLALVEELRNKQPVTLHSAFGPVFGPFEGLFEAEKGPKAHPKQPTE